MSGEGMEDLMWKRLVLAAALAVSVPASIVVTAAPAAAVPTCTDASAFPAHWSTQHSYNYAPGFWCMTDFYQEVVWQSDGNLVWYKNDGHVFWQSGTCTRCTWAPPSKQGAVRLSFQVDGNIVIYRSDGYPLWAIGESSHRTSSTNFYWRVERHPFSCFFTQTDWVLRHHQISPDEDLHVLHRCHQ
jgi:hypothetical protein